MKKHALLITLLALTACAQNGGMEPVDPRKLLDSFDGPKVPTVQDTLVDGGKAAEQRGDYKGAVQFYQQALQKHPENKEIALSLAESYRRSGEPDRALAIYDGLIEQDRANVGAKEGKALALMSKGDFDTPVDLLGEVLKADPTRWKTLNALGILFTTRDMHTEAQQYFTEALKYSPSNPSVLNNLGLSEALERNFDAAIMTLQEGANVTAAGSLDRKRIDLNLALVYASAGKLPEAQAIAERYFTGAALSNNLGLYAHLAKDDGLARDYLNMALTQSKTFYEKAWDNLQTISTQTQASPQAQPMAAPAPQPQPAPAAGPMTMVPQASMPQVQDETNPLASPPPVPFQFTPPPTQPAPKPKPKAKTSEKPSDTKTISNIVGNSTDKAYER